MSDELKMACIELKLLLKNVKATRKSSCPTCYHLDEVIMKIAAIKNLIESARDLYEG